MSAGATEKIRSEEGIKMGYIPKKICTKKSLSFLSYLSLPLKAQQTETYLLYWQRVSGTDQPDWTGLEWNKSKLDVSGVRGGNSLRPLMYHHCPRPLREGTLGFGFAIVIIVNMFFLPPP